jgi:hypothetical protein
VGGAGGRGLVGHTQEFGSKGQVLNCHRGTTWTSQCLTMMVAYR